MELIRLEDNQRMSSRDISDVTGKEHKAVLRDIDRLQVHYEKKGMPKVAQTPYVHPQNGQTYRQYMLTKMQTMDLMTGYSIPLRIMVNRRWEELEKAIKVPQTLSQALQLAADQAKKLEIQERQLELKDKEIEVEKEKRVIQQILAEREWDKIDREDLYNYGRR